MVNDEFRRMCAADRASAIVVLDELKSYQVRLGEHSMRSAQSPVDIQHKQLAARKELINAVVLITQRRYWPGPTGGLL
jgi:hypothetical protein